MQVNKNSHLRVVKNNQMRVVEINQMHVVTPKRKKSNKNDNMETPQLELLERNDNETLQEFAKKLGVTPKKILEQNKRPGITEIRYLYFKLRCEMHGISFSQAGREIGRSPATVKYGVESINNLLGSNYPKLHEMWKKIKDIPEVKE